MIEELQQLGLTKKEAEIYTKLAELGEIKANTLAKQTHSNRAGTYNILQQLIQKGLVQYTKKKTHRYYSISDPHFLNQILVEKQKLAEDLIKKIEKLKTKKPIKTDVNVYEGLEGMKIIHEELRKANKLLVLNATGLIFEHLKWGAKHIIKDISKNNIRIIANQSAKKTPLYKNKLISFKFLPKKSENYATTFIYKDTIVLQVLKDIPILIKIKNKEISKGYQKIFELLWKVL